MDRRRPCKTISAEPDLMIITTRRNWWGKKSSILATDERGLTQITTSLKNKNYQIKVAVVSCILLVSCVLMLLDMYGP